jgi:hypothetical protein
VRTGRWAINRQLTKITAPGFGLYCVLKPAREGKVAGEFAGVDREVQRRRQVYMSKGDAARVSPGLAEGKADHI